MDIATYKFQPTYSSPLQIGKLDTSSIKKEELPKEEVNIDKVESFDAENLQIKSMPEIDTTKKIDLYA